MLNMRNAAIAAITSASLPLLAWSVAQAHGSEKKPTHRAIYNTTRMPSAITPTANGGLNQAEFMLPFAPGFQNSNGG